ncbi:MAG: SMP-30/gluconolactonase/LRE family protein [Steroidobacteraceae bacterium]
MTREIVRLYTGGSFFEGPRWRDGRWYVSDFYQHHVLAIDERGRAQEVMKVPQQASGTGWLPDGSLIVASMRDHKLLRRWPDGQVSVHADVSAYCGGWLNDIVVDGLGRAWCGNFGYDHFAGEAPRTTNIIRVDPDGRAAIAASDMHFPNGSVVTPDNRTLIIGETTGACYTAFTIAGDGTLSNRRVWAALRDLVPDGCCLDAQGRIWSADPRDSRARLIEEGGRVVEEIRTPDGMAPFACMLGGADGKTLLLACSPPGVGAGREGKTDGCLFTTRVDVPRAGYP